MGGYRCDATPTRRNGQAVADAEISYLSKMLLRQTDYSRPKILPLTANCQLSLQLQTQQNRYN